MSTLWRKRRGRTLTVVAAALAIVILTLVTAHRLPTGHAQVAAALEDQTYIGTRQCAACHFPQFRTWRGTPHEKAFEVLPAKYKSDAECLKCHTTGAGAESGFKSEEETPDLAGISCEACHGPGSEHAKIAQESITADITPELEQAIRTSTQKIAETNVCIVCHVTRAHKEHPAYDAE